VQVGWHPLHHAARSERWEVFPRLAPADQGSTTAQVLYFPQARDERCDTNQVPCPLPTLLLLQPLRQQCQLSGCSLCSVHLHQRAHLKAHHTSAYYRDEAIPALPPHWSRLNVSASAVISIRQGCNHSMANLRQTCTSPMYVLRLISPMDAGSGGTQRAYRGLCV
jgi:hypothetical protein